VGEEKGLMKGKVFELTGLADYQEGAVVSRTVVDSKAGTVTAFAFAAGQGLSEHTAPYDALVLVVEGRVEVVIDGVPLELGAGQMVVMPAQRPHALRALEPFKMILVMIRE